MHETAGRTACTHRFSGVSIYRLCRPGPGSPQDIHRWRIPVALNRHAELDVAIPDEVLPPSAPTPPSVTFRQARRIVEAALAPSWPSDADSWHVSAGAREAEDGDLDFLVMDAPAFFVSKSTGTLSLAVVIENLDRLARMVPVHDDLPDA